MPIMKIRTKKKRPCKICGKKVNLHKQMCRMCFPVYYPGEVIPRHIEDLKRDLDALVIRYIYATEKDEDGLVRCYITKRRLPPSETNVSHFLTRSKTCMRWDLRFMKIVSKSVEINERRVWSDSVDSLGIQMTRFQEKFRRNLVEDYGEEAVIELEKPGACRMYIKKVQALIDHYKIEVRKAEAGY